MEQLLQPSQEATAQYHTVLISALRQFVPPDFDVKCVPIPPDAPSCAATILAYRTSGTYMAERGVKVMRIPCPETELCLFIGLHEVGHVANRDPGGIMFNPPDAERKASEFAKRYMETHGVPVSSATWEEALTMADISVAGRLAATTGQWGDYERLAAKLGLVPYQELLDVDKIPIQMFSLSGFGAEGASS